MQEDSRNRGTPSRRKPLRAARDWLGNPSTNADALASAAIFWVATTIVAAAIGALLSALEIVHLGGELATPIVIAGFALCLGVGLLLGALAIGQLYFRPRLRRLESAREDAIGELGALPVIEAYAEQLGLVLTADLGTGPLAGEEKMLFHDPAKLIERSVGTKVHISLWVPTLGADGAERWEPCLWPTHAPHERDDFRVPLDSSWIALAQRRQGNKVFGLDDIGKWVRRGVAAGDDLAAFLSHDLHSLACCTVGLSEESPAQHGPCLVMLGKDPGAFSRKEEWLFLFLARVLALHLRIHALGEELEGEVAP